MTAPPPLSQTGPALLARLWQRTERPGCVRHGQSRAIVARHQRMADGPPLAGLLLARARGIVDTQQSPPVVADARRVSYQPGAVPDLAAEAALSASRPTASARLAPPHDPAPRGSYRPVRETPPDSGGPTAAVTVPAGTGATERPLPRDAATRPVTRPAAHFSQVHQIHRVSRADGAGQPAMPPMPAADPVEPSTGPVELAGSRPTAAGSYSDPAGRPVVRVESGGRPLAPAAPPARPLVTPAVTPPARPFVTPLATPAVTPRLTTGQTPGQAAESARPPVPVVRERTPPGGTWATGPSPSQRPAQFSAVPSPAPPPARPAASRPGEPPEPRRATREHRTEREAERTERTGPERAEVPAVDMDHIVVTVQRRLMHQFAIDRERRGMTR
jgi:hypothetical protein